MVGALGRSAVFTSKPVESVRLSHAILPTEAPMLDQEKASTRGKSLNQFVADAIAHA